MSVKRVILVFGILMAVAFAPPLTGNNVVEAEPLGVKFFVVDWRVTWEADTKGLLLQLKGRTRGNGGDLGSDFEIQTRNVTPVLEVLRTCAMGRLTGAATVRDNSKGIVTGEKLTSLSCRAILK
jgi:hypothetical protein